MKRFEGFADAKATFFKRLAKKNDRVWFLAHKDEFETGWNTPMKALLDALLRERLPEDRQAAARDCWTAIEKRDLLHRRDLLKARLRDPDLSHGEITEIQKQILDLQKLITDISRPFSPSGPE